MAIEKADVWLNKSKSGKAVTLKTEDGTLYVSNIEYVRRLVNSEEESPRGVSFGRIVEDEKE